MDVDGWGHPKVLMAGGPNGVAHLLAELRQAVHAEVGGDPAGDGLRNPQATVAPLEGACSKVERRARAPGTPSTVRRISARSENSDMLYGPRSVAGISTCAP